jgi:plastocyanin
MHKALLATLLAFAVALAGCSGGGGGHKADQVTCPDGTVLTAEQIEADERHHEAGFNATMLCPAAPKVTLSGLPATIQVYDSASFTWAVDPGSVAKPHSMLTSIRYSKTAVPDAEATLEKYATEIIKKEHQDLPVTFKGNMTFNQPGKVYVRAYAQVKGEGFAQVEVWSPEVVLDVLPVNATGVVETITHALGPVGELDPATLDLKLGDAIKFANEDLVDHELHLESGPPGAAACELVAPGQGESTDACVLSVPGTYEFETTGDAQPKSITINVSKA